MSLERMIPKSAVKPLVEHCKKLGEEAGRPVTEIFREYLELMRKYADYFFSEPWPEKMDKQVEFRDKDVEFIEESKSGEEECERFTLVCLRRNISMEGFDSQGFTEDFDFYGRIACWGCSVHEATQLRREAERKEQFRKEIEEEMEGKKPSWVAREMDGHLKRPDVMRGDKMLLVELRLYEEMGSAKGKSCEVRNKYRCPYMEESARLIEDGEFVMSLWRYIEWYDHHWNRSHTFTPSIEDLKWYHYDEPSIIDVTSYEDILKAFKDGRLEKIIKEYVKYIKETGR